MDKHKILQDEINLYHYREKMKRKQLLINLSKSISFLVIIGIIYIIINLI